MRRLKPLLNLIFLILFACSGSEMPDSDSRLSARKTTGPTVQEQAWQQIRAGALLIDVRTPIEFDQGHLDGAINIPYDQLKTRIAEIGDDRGREIVLYCRSGRRSEIGGKTLEKLGFTRVLDAGGYQSLLRAR